ncbi:unnamed protein product [Rotaria magnacalcarata]|uniref:Uncharacterized protein n=1 Tax=Rotaria magnacalcarata TaxID=392030 RepID=A0A815XTB7_9BILA|nr:unnamed protein product [Rotaria magnacalcarata]
MDDNENLISNDRKSLLNFSEKFTSKVKIKEHRKLNDNLVIDDLNSINVLTSNLLMDQTFEILPTIDGIDEHKSILNSKSNLSSSHTVDQLTSERKDQIHENDDNVQVINLDQHETTLLKHSISLQSKASVSKTHTLAFLCQRNTLQADKDLPTLHDVSVSNSIHFETKIQEKELNETANEFPVVTTSRKPINNTNEYKELPLIFPKHAGRRKRLRKKQHNELPPWIFPKENSTTYNHRFKRPHCKPCECICTPLPTCSNVPSRSFLDDIHPCDTYSIQ